MEVAIRRQRGKYLAARTTRPVQMGGTSMADTHLLLGSFDLLNIGHLTQFDAVAQAESHVVAAVISDDGVAALSGSAPFLPAAERSAVVSQLRVVDSTCITGPENRWTLPDHDVLYVDAGIWDLLTSAGLDIRHALAVEPTRLPTNPALLSAVTAA